MPLNKETKEIKDNQVDPFVYTFGSKVEWVLF